MIIAWEYTYDCPRGSFVYRPKNDSDIPYVGQEIFLLTHKDPSQRGRPYGMIVRVNKVTPVDDNESTLFIETDFPERMWNK